MFKNYLKITIRNIFKKKFYSFLNLLGLAIGITAGILIILYVQDELSYDQFHPNVENKYVIGLAGKLGYQEINGVFTPPSFAKTAVEEIPGVINSIRTNSTDKMVFRHENQAFTEENVWWADSNFFHFFGYELLQGDPKTVLNGPNKVVISRSTAQKYFADLNPIGQTLIVGNDKSSFEVTGVSADPPHNSHLKYDILLSFSTTEYSRSDNWLNNNLNTYTELQEGVNLKQIENHFDELILKYVGPKIQEIMGMSIDQLRKQGGVYGYFTVPVLDLHLNVPNIQTSFKPPGDITYVYIFSVVGFFLILIACVNFMNLSTASAAGRAKEVGLRKTLGSKRSGLIVQFLVESIIYAVLAVLISLVLLYLFLPWFNLLSGKELTLQIFTEPWFITTLGGLTILIGLLAGSYPAIYLTGFNPVDVLKGKISQGAKSSGFRRALVVVQFFISIALIACTLLINEQLQFMQNNNLGFDKERTMVLTNTSQLDNNRKAFKEDLMNDSRVQAASYTTNTIPGSIGVTIFKRPETNRDHIMSIYFADYDHKEALGFEMAEGRYFSQDFPTDSSAVVINKAAVTEMELEELIGKELIYPDRGNKIYKVIGVMKNFNFESLRNEIMPLVLILTPTANKMIVRFQSQDPHEAVNMIESTWSKYAGNKPVNYSFLDEDFDQLFRQELQLGQVFTAFTIIAIFIACLGLLGLSAYMNEQRRQEIGIRKVLGASTISIIGLFSTEFLKLTGIAFTLAMPVAWYFIQIWLQDFAYRIEVRPIIFILTAVVTTIIVLLALSWQTMKAAFMNPVESIG